MPIQGTSSQPKKEPEPEPEPIVAEELDEAQNVAAWRYLMLLDLNISPDDALTLISDPLCDWHAAEKLVKQGCPPDKVLGILA